MFFKRKNKNTDDIVANAIMTIVSNNVAYISKLVNKSKNEDRTEDMTKEIFNTRIGILSDMVIELSKYHSNKKALQNYTLALGDIIFNESESYSMRILNVNTLVIDIFIRKQ